MTRIWKEQVLIRAVRPHVGVKPKIPLAEHKAENTLESRGVRRLSWCGVLTRWAWFGWHRSKPGKAFLLPPVTAADCPRNVLAGRGFSKNQLLPDTNYSERIFERHKRNRPVERDFCLPCPVLPSPASCCPHSSSRPPAEERAAVGLLSSCPRRPAAPRLCQPSPAGAGALAPPLHLLSALTDRGGFFPLWRSFSSPTARAPLHQTPHPYTDLLIACSVLSVILFSCYQNHFSFPQINLREPQKPPTLLVSVKDSM